MSEGTLPVIKLVAAAITSDRSVISKNILTCLIVFLLLLLRREELIVPPFRSGFSPGRISLVIGNKDIGANGGRHSNSRLDPPQKLSGLVFVLALGIVFNQPI